MLDGPLYPWETDYSRRLDEARRHSHALPDEDLDSTSAEALTDAIVNEHSAQDVVLAYEAIESKTYNMSAIAGADVARDAQPTRLELAVPCAGAGQELRHAGGGLRATGEHAWVTLQFDVPIAFDQAQLVEVREQWFASLRAGAEQANEVIRGHRRELRDAVRRIIEPRHATRQAILSATNALDIPLNQGDGEQRFFAPRPKLLTLKDIERTVTAGGNEHGLAVDIADAIVAQIESFALALERSPNTANKIASEDEETLRDVLLFVLNANWQGLATGETFLGKGKTDILLRWRNRDAFIGECKFWHGERLFDAGLEQLLGRYTVWRDTRVAMLLFIRDRTDVSSVIEKATARIEAHPRYVGPGAASSSFRLWAQHDAAKIVVAHLIPVVMPTM
jgi:hypothetical protein